MTNDASSERTVVIAAYSTRRDAEMARDRLQDENIQAFITADDAGGMHPELQRPHGVHLVVLSSKAQAAHEVLEDVGLFPSYDDDQSDIEGPAVGAEARSESPREEQTEDLTFSTKRVTFITIVVVILIILGLLLLTLREIV